MANLAEFFIAVVFLLVLVPVLVIVASISNRMSELSGLIDAVREMRSQLESLDRKITALGVPSPTQATAPAAPSQPLQQRQPVQPAPSAQPQPRQPIPSPTIPAGVVHGTEPPTASAPGTSVPPRPTVPSPAPHAPVPVHSAAPPRPPLTPLPALAYSHFQDRDVESTIAGRWFNYVGILAVALAVSFFLKYAFDNNWIGPAGRVAIGLLLGSSLYALSHWILKRGYTYYAEGITALGAFILYLSVWAGWHYYHVFSQSSAFLLMIVVTAVTVTVALRRDSQRIAVLALIGGLLTPVLVSTGQNAEVNSSVTWLCSARECSWWRGCATGSRSRRSPSPPA